MAARRFALGSAVWAAGVLVLAGACSGPAAPDAEGSRETRMPGHGADRGRATPPEGAIEVEAGRYMVPSGPDERGCMTYRAWSTTRPVLPVVYYRKRDGGFTAIAGEADCGT